MRLFCEISFISIYCFVLNSRFAASIPVSKTKHQQKAKNIEELTGDCGKLWETRSTADENLWLAANYTAHIATQQEKLPYWDVAVKIIEGKLMDCRWPRFNLTAVFATSNCSTSMSWEELDKAICTPQPQKATKTCQSYLWVPPGKGGKLESHKCVVNEVKTKTVHTTTKATAAPKEISQSFRSTTEATTTHGKVTTSDTKTTKKQNEVKHENHHNSWDHHVPLRHQQTSESSSAMVAAVCVVPIAAFALYTYKVLRGH